MSADNERRIRHPYWTRTLTISYEEAKEFCLWFKEASGDNSLLGLCYAGRKCYELVGFAHNADGDCIAGCDSEYVIFKVAKRLVRERLADFMETTQRNEPPLPEGYAPVY